MIIVECQSCTTRYSEQEIEDRDWQCYCGWQEFNVVDLTKPEERRKHDDLDDSY